MGLFGDVFKAITAPARLVAKSPLGDVAKVAAPMIPGVGPLAGIGISAGIGALRESDDGIGDMAKGAVGGAAEGAASYGLKKGVGAAISELGGGGADAAMDAATPGAANLPAPEPLGPAEAAAVHAGPEGAMPSLPGAGGSPGPQGPQFDEAISGPPAGFDEAIYSDTPAAMNPNDPVAGPGGSMMGLGDMPDWLKWSLLLQAGSKVAGTAYDIYDTERARGRGENFGKYLAQTMPSRPPMGGSY